MGFLTFLLHEVGNVLLCLLLRANLLLDFVHLGVDLGGRVCGCDEGGGCQYLVRVRALGARLTLAMVLPHGNHLIDNLNWGKSFALALLDQFRVAAALGNCSTHRLAYWV